MSWARIDDGLFENPKFADLSDRAKLLYIASLVYGNKHLTDGLVPPSGLRLVKAWANANKNHVSELVMSGLWKLVLEGHVVHDWADYNIPSAKVKAQQRAARERMYRLRSGEQDGEQPPARSGDTHTPTPISPITHPVTRPIPSNSGGGSTRTRKKKGKTAEALEAKRPSRQGNVSEG